MTGIVLTQGTNPAGQAPPPGGRGRGGDPAQRGGEPGGERQGRGGRRGGFPQFTREAAPQDALVRGKSLYEANCASCHAVDLRGGPNGANLLRSGTALNDRKGELIGTAVSRHTPPLTMVTDDTVAIADYIHSVHSTMGGQGSPPGRNPVGLQYNLLVGNPDAGATQFASLCASCHSVTGDLQGIGTRYPDARALQNAWFSGSGGFGGGGGGGGGGGRGGGGGAGNPATVTLADNTKLEGTLVRKDDFLVILMLADGTRKSIARSGVRTIEVKDPREAHKNMAMKLIFDDPENKKLHDITAYLASIK
jgi:cytochrome c oxidase cbb3-type subunit 3